MTVRVKGPQGRGGHAPSIVPIIGPDRTVIAAGIIGRRRRIAG
jgi:hypothetical protein